MHSFVCHVLYKIGVPNSAFRKNLIEIFGYPDV